MAAPLTLKDRFQESRLFRERLVWVISFIGLMVFLLFTRYFYLQIIKHEAFSTQADANRILTIPLVPTRGLILDRKGDILADSRPSFSLSLIKEQIDDLDETMNELRLLIGIRDDEIEKFKQRLYQRNRRPFEPVPLRYRLSDEEIAIIAVNEWRLPGVEVEAQLVRNYPYNKLFAHAIGYMGSINDKDLEDLSEKNLLEKYHGMYSIGKLGLEKVYEEALYGIPGGQNVETNAKGKVIRFLQKIPPVPGKNLELFIDRNLQELTTEKLAGQRAGAVAIEIKTGGVIVAVSTPSYDPNLFVTGISSKDYSALRDDWQIPLYNRMWQGQYPPGSTIKPLLALAGLEYNIVTPSYSIADPGWFRLPGDDRFYRDWKKSGHGSRVNMRQAIAESCDTYFYRLGHQLGVDRMATTLAQFGIGSKTGIDQTGERNGILPTREWKKKRSGLAWYPGDTINISIGQGDMLVTPMQLAYATSIIANRGERIVPRFVKRIGNKETPMQTLTRIELNNPANWDQIIEDMTAVVHDPHGTAAHLSRNIDYKIAGKTGTAQVIGIKQNEKYNAALIALQKRDHALFIAFAPAEQPEIAVAVIIENGEHGSSAAAPVAKTIIDAYLKDRHGQ